MALAILGHLMAILEDLYLFSESGGEERRYRLYLERHTCKYLHLTLGDMPQKKLIVLFFVQQIFEFFTTSQTRENTEQKNLESER